MREVVDRATLGEVDRLVFSLSSHGTQIPDLSGDEEVDHADETFAMYDIHQGEDSDSWDTSSVIVDDELHALLTGVLKGLLVEVVPVTRHSGNGLTSLDFLPGRRPRFLPPPTSSRIETVEGADPVGLRDLIKGKPAKQVPVLFAACRPDQTASDGHFAGQYKGAFTHYLIPEQKSDVTQSRSHLLSGAKGLRWGKFAQLAQLEAPAGAKKLAFAHAW